MAIDIKMGLILLILLRNTGATASGGGATPTSYLLFTKPFTKPFTDELISLGYRDTMWDREAMENFFWRSLNPAKGVSFTAWHFSMP